MFDYHLYPFSSLWRSSEAELARYRALFSAAGMDRELQAQLTLARGARQALDALEQACATIERQRH